MKQKKTRLSDLTDLLKKSKKNLEKTMKMMCPKMLEELSDMPALSYAPIKCNLQRMCASKMPRQKTSQESATMARGFIMKEMTTLALRCLQ